MVTERLSMIRSDNPADLATSPVRCLLNPAKLGVHIEDLLVILSDLMDALMDDLMDLKKVAGSVSIRVEFIFGTFRTI